MTHPIILITGEPGVGKTTLIISLAKALKEMNPVGFYTRETRGPGGGRTGFELVSIPEGRTARLSAVGLDGPKIGRYGVDVPAFEAFLNDMNLSQEGGGLVVIDEIGKMECLSDKFVSIMTGIISYGRPLLATVAKRGGGLIAGVKQSEGSLLYELTRDNRDRAMDELIRTIRE